MRRNNTWYVLFCDSYQYEEAEYEEGEYEDITNMENRQNPTDC